MQKPWLLKAANRTLGLFMFLYGLVALAVDDDKIPTSPIDDFGLLINVEPHVILGLLFMLPGVFVLVAKPIKIGLWMTVGSLCLFTVGLVEEAVIGGGTATAPIVYGFLTFLAVVILVINRDEGQ